MDAQDLETVMADAARHFATGRVECAVCVRDIPADGAYALTAWILPDHLRDYVGGASTVVYAMCADCAASNPSGAPMPTQQRLVMEAMGKLRQGDTSSFFQLDLTPSAESLKSLWDETTPSDAAEE